MKNIFPKIEFHKTYLLISIGFILTGYFSNLIIFTSIILIHESGHYIIAKLLKLNVEKIIIYPYGGITKLNIPINTKIKKELLVAISGIIFQSLYFILIIILYKINIIRPYIYKEFITYHHSILFFNILPIYPLDGSKILSLLLSNILPYKKVLYINLLISIITTTLLLLLNIYQNNYTFIIIITIIIDNIIKYYKNIKYHFNKFLLERYLHYYNFKKISKITNINNIYKERKNIIKQKNTYISEYTVLNSYFSHKNQ